MKFHILLLLLVGACLPVFTQEIKPKPELLPADEAPKDPEAVFSEGEPFELTDALDTPKNGSVPVPEPEPKPEPEPEPEPKPEPEPSPTPEPEPAIKFDNIESEDYGDVAETAASTQPDELNTEVIEQLVDTFLNTGSIASVCRNKTQRFILLRCFQNKTNKGPVFANPVAQALVNSSNYWKTDNLQVK